MMKFILMKLLQLSLIFVPSILARNDSGYFKKYEPTELDFAKHIIALEVLQSTTSYSLNTGFRNKSILTDQKCLDDLQEMQDGYRRLENWAVLMLDSQVKRDTRILDSKRVILGNMDECIHSVHPTRNFSGQFCLLYFNDTRDPIDWKQLGSIWFREPYLFTSMCYPSSCSRQFLNMIVKEAYDPIAPNRTLNSGFFEVGIVEGDCVTRDTSLPMTSLNWVTISILASLVALIGMSTLWDVCRADNLCGNVGQMVLAFSLTRNGRRFLAAMNAPGKASSTVVGGFKSLTALYVVATHIVYTHLNGLVDTLGMAVMSQDGSQAGAAFLNNGYNSVETFLLISGMLMVFSFLNEVKRKGSYDPLLSLLKRYLRLMLPLYVMYLIRIGVSEHLGSGPVYGAFNRYHRRNCITELMPMFLGYINFYDFPFNTCFQQTWYVYLDLQLFIISQAVLLVALWRPDYSFKLAGAAALVGLVVDFTVTYVNDLGFIPPYDRHLNMLLLEYVVPHTRCVPWFLGMMLAFHLKQCELKPVKLSTRCQVIGWTVYLVVFATTFFPVVLFRWGIDYQAGQALFGAYRRLGWATMVGWPIYVAHIGYAGFLNKLLSWPPVVFYGLISYELYLLHFPFIEFLIATGTETFFLSYPRVWYLFAPILVYSTLLAVVMYLCVSVPLTLVVTQLLQNIKLTPLKHRWTRKAKPGTDDANTTSNTKL